LRAMTQTFLAAARKKKAAEAAAAATGAAESSPVLATSPSVSATRDERECPFCAERILKKAKVCKHCRRDVVPLAE
jgi:hypothetical protein